MKRLWNTLGLTLFMMLAWLPAAFADEAATAAATPTIDTGDTATKAQLITDLKALGVTQLDYLVLTHAHADTRQKQVDEILAQATSHSGHTPKHHADGNQFWAGKAVGQIGQRQTHKSVEQRKGQTM